MKKLTKRLELTFYMADDYVLTEIYEPESDEKTYINAPYDPDEHPEFDEKLCMEIYSWLSLWMDEMEDSDEE